MATVSPPVKAEDVLRQLVISLGKEAEMRGIREDEDLDAIIEDVQQRAYQGRYGDGNAIANHNPLGSLVKIGSHVEVELISASGETERLAFDLVRDAAADFAAGFLGIGTPLGRALVGRPQGATVPYRVADVVAAAIVRVTESERAPDAGAAEARQAAAREAVERHDREERTRLSLTFSSKWGEWDEVEIGD